VVPGGEGLTSRVRREGEIPETGDTQHISTIVTDRSAN
jgi:hypothetical protein